MACLAYLLHQRGNGKALFGYVAELPYLSSSFNESGEVVHDDFGKDVIDLESELVVSYFYCELLGNNIVGWDTEFGGNEQHSCWRLAVAKIFGSAGLGCNLDPRSYHVVDRVFSDREFHASLGLKPVGGVRQERKANA